LFFAIKEISTLQKREAAKPVEPSREAEVLTEIRDLLKKSLDSHRDRRAV
jgi:large-conductance mechanosensitive channel